MADLGERGFLVPGEPFSGRPSGSRFRNGDALMARITPCLQNGKTGLVQFLDDGQTAVGSTEFIVLRGRVVGPAFAYCAARSSAFRGHAIQSMSGATGRQRVSRDCFDSLMMVEPSPAAAAHFEEVAGPLFDQGFQLAQQNRRLAATRDLLLPRLVTGQVDLSEIDLGDLLEEAAA